VLVQRVEAAKIVRVERKVRRDVKDEGAAEERESCEQHRVDRHQPQRPLREELEQARELELEPPRQLIVREAAHRGLDRLKHRGRALDLRETRSLFKEPLAARWVALVGGMLREGRPHVRRDLGVRVAEAMGVQEGSRDARALGGHDVDDVVSEGLRR